MRLTGVDIAVLAGAGGAVLLVLVWTIATRISTGRRVSAIALRLGADPHEAAGRGMERKLTRLERTAEHAVTLVGEAGVTADRLTRALDAVGEGVVVCDEQGDVVYRNGAGRDLVTPGPAEDAVRELVGQALGGTPAEETVEVPGSPARTLRVAVAPVDDEWRTLGAVAIVEDASDRRRVDDVRRAFVDNVARELRTPIAGMAALADAMVAEGDRVAARRLADRVARQAQRLTTVVDGLLDLGRIEALETVRREPVPVEHLMAGAVDRVRPEAERRRVGIEWTEPAHRLAVVGDAGQLVTALAHLLDNAVRHSKAGGTVELAGRSDGSVVELAVRDRGKGIPSRHVGRIFERFYRVDRGDDSGGGLGLAIVRHVATSHGGEVLVHSAEGEGSTFILRLPGPPGPVAMSQAG